jgi:hypothetical protein
MLSRHIDGGFHVVCQDNELRRAIVVMDVGASVVLLPNLLRKFRNLLESRVSFYPIVGRCAAIIS